MSTVTRTCAVRREHGSVTRGVPLQARHPRRRDHRRRLRRRQRSAAQAGVRGKRASTSSAIQRAGGAALGSASAADPGPGLDAGVPRLQPGAGDAAQGRHAAGAVARHPAPARHQLLFKSVLDDVLRAGAGGQLAVRGVRGARDAVSRRLHRVAARRREERQPRTGHPPLRRLRQSGGERQAQDDLGAGLSGDPDACCRSSSSSIIVLRVVPEFGAVLPAVRRELPLSTRIIVAISDVARGPTFC